MPAFVWCLVATDQNASMMQAVWATTVSQYRHKKILAVLVEHMKKIGCQKLHTVSHLV